MCKTGECIICGIKSFWLISDGPLFGKFCSWKCHDDNEETIRESEEQRALDAENASPPWGESVANAWEENR